MELESNDGSMTTHHDLYYDLSTPAFDNVMMARHIASPLPQWSPLPPSAPPATSTTPYLLPPPIPEPTRPRYTQENLNHIKREYALSQYTFEDDFALDFSAPFPPTFSRAPKVTPNQPDAPAMRCQACHELLPSPIFLTCGHAYCRECLNQLFTVGTSNRASWPPRCCLGRNRGIEIEQVQDHLDQQVLLRYISVADEFRDRRPTYCDHATCSEYLGPERLMASSKFLQCPKCHSLTCSLCKQNSAGHTGVNNDECRPPEELMSPGDLKLAKSKRWRQCPGCRILVERIDGCPHMMCACGVEFCYDCGDQSDPFDPSCACTIAARRAIEARRNNRRTVMDRVRDVLPSSGRRRRGEWEVPRTRYPTPPLHHDDDWLNSNPPFPPSFSDSPPTEGYRPQTATHPTQTSHPMQRPAAPYDPTFPTQNPSVSSTSPFRLGLNQYMTNTDHDNMNAAWLRNPNWHSRRLNHRPLSHYSRASGADAHNIRIKTAAERSSRSSSQHPTHQDPRLVYSSAPSSSTAPVSHQYTPPVPFGDYMSLYPDTYRPSVGKRISSSSSRHTKDNDPATTAPNRNLHDEMLDWHWQAPFFAPRAGGQGTNAHVQRSPGSIVPLVEGRDVDVDVSDTPSLSPSSNVPTNLRSRR